MEKEKRIPLTDDWYIGTDGMSFILIKRRVVGPGARSKQENIGQERFEPMGYYGTLGSLAAGLHRYLSMEALMQSSVLTLEDYARELEAMIDRVRKTDLAMMSRLKDRMGVCDE